MESLIETVRTLTGQTSSPENYFAEPSFNLDKIVRTLSLSCPIDGTFITRSLFDTSSLDPISEDGPLVTSSIYSLGQDIPSHSANASQKRHLIYRDLDFIRSAYAQAMTAILRNAQRSAQRLLDKRFKANSCYSFEKLQAEFPTYTTPSGLTEALTEMLAGGSLGSDFWILAKTIQRTLSAELNGVRQEAQGTRPDMWVNIEPSVDNAIVAVGIDVLYRVWRNGLASPLLPALAWSHFLFESPQVEDQNALRVCRFAVMIDFQKLVLMKLDELFLEWISHCQPEENTDYDSDWESEELFGDD